MSRYTSTMNVVEAAAFVGVSISMLNKLRVYGGGPVFLKIGRRVAYDPSDLSAWLNQLRRRSTSDVGVSPHGG